MRFTLGADFFVEVLVSAPVHHRWWSGSVGNDRQMVQSADNLAQQFEPLASQIGRLNPN